MALPYAFRPMTSADLPLIRQWLAQPHVREWWGDPEEQYVLVSGDLDEPAMDQYVISTGGIDFGYVQCYDLTAWNSGFGTHPESLTQKGSNILRAWQGDASRA
jgi:aminoglycoside 6'-N-acetyltransferase